jgi:predicted XRE-type DNA-binding protein
LGNTATSQFAIRPSVAACGSLGITQPRLNDLLRSKIANFSLDTLIDLAAQAGLSVRLDVADAA